MDHLTIYMNRAGDSTLHREGFSWAAAIAFPVWALTRCLYKTALVSCVVLLIISQIERVMAAPISAGAVRIALLAAFHVGLAAAAGFAAGPWQRRVLERDGYSAVATDRRSSNGTCDEPHL